MSDSVPIAVLGEDEAAKRLRDYDILPTQQRLMIARVLFEGRHHYSA